MAGSVHPYLRYRDAPAAIDWLERAFGFERRDVIENPDGTIAHAEMRWGSGTIMLASERDDPHAPRAGKGWNYVVIEDADAHHDRARAAGAEIVMELSDMDYGSRDYAARDLEGNLWSFGTYAPE